MDSLSRRWDQASPRLTGDARGTRYAKCVRYLADHRRDAAILEVGCGHGHMLKLLRELGFKNLFGFDYCIENVRQAKKQVPGALLFGGDLHNLSLKDESVDVVISSAVIEHVESPAQAVLSMARLLRKNGVAIISSDCFFWRIEQMLGAYKSFMPIDRAMSPFTLLKIFRDCGFDVLHHDAWGSFAQHLYHLVIPTTFREVVRRMRRRRFSTRQSKLPVSIERKPVTISRIALLKHFCLDENVFYLRKAQDGL